MEKVRVAPSDPTHAIHPALSACARERAPLISQPHRAVEGNRYGRSAQRTASRASASRPRHPMNSLRNEPSNVAPPPPPAVDPPLPASATLSLKSADAVAQTRQRRRRGPNGQHRRCSRSHRSRRSCRSAAAERRRHARSTTPTYPRPFAPPIPAPSFMRACACARSLVLLCACVRACLFGRARSGPPHPSHLLGPFPPRPALPPQTPVPNLWGPVRPPVGPAPRRRPALRRLRLPLLPPPCPTPALDPPFSPLAPREEGPSGLPALEAVRARPESPPGPQGPSPRPSQPRFRARARGSATACAGLRARLFARASVREGACACLHLRACE